MKVLDLETLVARRSSKIRTIRQSRATTLTTIAFATLLFTAAPAATRESWPQRVETDWLLAEEVAAQDQLGGLLTTKADAAREALVQTAVG